MKELLIATSNPGKLHEITTILHGVPFILRSLTDCGLAGDFQENGISFAEIASQKALHFAHLSHLPTIAEDSGIFVDAFPGELGIYTRRWGAPHTGTTDAEWIAYFLQRMKDVPPSKRTARFVCAAAFVVDGIVTVFHGETKGLITRNLQAPIQKGLPLSSCFVPEGFDVVYATLSAQEKAPVSHRGKALAALKSVLLK